MGPPVARNGGGLTSLKLRHCGGKCLFGMSRISMSDQRGLSQPDPWAPIVRGREDKESIFVIFIY